MEGVNWLVTRIGAMYDKLHVRVAKDVLAEKLLGSRSITND